MNMQNASWVKWSGLTVSLAMLAGCVINPYVKAPTAPLTGGGPECEQLAGSVISAEFTSAMPSTDRRGLGKAGNRQADATATKDGLDDAMTYAICTQRAMERKAGKYAWMNQGGALMLIHMAGLAGYSGTRGGHNAQVAAMTTGGATFYGAQQYLYRKPREAIYWSGAEAVGCAITVTNRRLVAQGDEYEMKEFYANQIQKPYSELEKVEESERGLRGDAKAPASCSGPENGGMRTTWAGLIKRVDDARSAHSLRDLDKARLLAKLQLNQFVRQSRSARSDLVDVTAAIRLAVNRQLAAQQPDPAELARLLTGLKLPALAGSSTSAKQDVEDSAPENRSSAIVVPSATTPTPACTKEVAVYRQEVERFMELHEDVRNGIEAFTAKFNRSQAESDTGPKPERPIEQCLQLRANALRPFGVVMAQSGALKVAVGGTARVAIVGGLPPFDAEPLSDGSNVSAEPKLNESGEYEFVITAESAAKVGKVKFFATDDAGGSDMFTVEVVAAPK